MNTDISQILEKIETREKRDKKRAILITFIPLIAAVILITYTTQKILNAQKELNIIENRMKQAESKVMKAQAELRKVDSLNNSLNKKNDSLYKSLIGSVETLGKTISVTNEFKKFVDRKPPALRTREEASTYVSFHMLEDRIRGNYEFLSKIISEFPKIDDQIWIVIVKSSTSLQDLKMEANSVISIYKKQQIAIYQDGKNYYALSVIGNGTFTRAYRLNVELRDTYGFDGAYFSHSQDWGKNYLNNEK